MSFLRALIIPCCFLIFLSPVTAGANGKSVDQEIKDDSKQVGKEVAHAGKGVGKEGKKVGLEIKKGSKHAWKDVKELFKKD